MAMVRRRGKRIGHKSQLEERWKYKMTRHLISFDDGAMVIPEQDLPAVGEAAHAVVKAAQEAGVWIFGGGVESQRASIVETDGTVSEGPYPETKPVVGGFVIIDVHARNGTAMGRQVCCRLPVRAGSTRDHVRPFGLTRSIIERTALWPV